MSQRWLLKDFFREHGVIPRDVFLQTFSGGFLLVRFRDTPPLVAHLPAKENLELIVGSDEDVDLDFIADPTLDEKHCKLAYHTGFKGWTVEDLGSSFGTHLDEERVSANRPTLLQDRSVIKPGGGLLEMQYYTAESLHRRMTEAGVTRSLRRAKQKLEQAESDEGPTS